MQHPERRRGGEGAIAWIRQIKIPFFATLPSLLYEQDALHPSFARFKEARAVHIRKEYSLQLCMQDFCWLARGMEHFASRAHHSVFLFLEGEVCGGREWTVRGFRLTRRLELQEETDRDLVMLAWREFQSSPRASHAVDERQWEEKEGGEEEDLSSGQRGEAHVHRARCDLKTRVSVPSWSCLTHYCADPSDMRLLHSTTCNLFSSSVEVPLLMPRSELLPGGGGSDEDAAGQGSRRVRRRMQRCAVLQSIQAAPVMPEGWYRKNLIGARIHCIEAHRSKSMMACQMLDGRLFRFREHFPNVPMGKRERKHGRMFFEDECDEGGEGGGAAAGTTRHDDEAPSPCMLLAALARGRERRENTGL